MLTQAADHLFAERLGRDAAAYLRQRFSVNNILERLVITGEIACIRGELSVGLLFGSVGAPSCFAHTNVPVVSLRV